MAIENDIGDLQKEIRVLEEKLGGGSAREQPTSGEEGFEISTTSPKY